LILECLLTKDRPTDELTWTFNGDPLIIDNERIKVSKDGPIVKLIIDEGQLSDDGRYQAEINDKTSRATVIVKGNNYSILNLYLIRFVLFVCLFQRKNFNLLVH